MASFLDKGRERAKHIVDRVSKAAHFRDTSQPTSREASMDVSSKVPSGSQKSYGFTTFKRALDDTDTLLLRDTSFNRAFSLSRTSDPSASTSAAADAAVARADKSSKQGPAATGNMAWDLPLASSSKASRASRSDQNPSNSSQPMPPPPPPPPPAVDGHDSAAASAAIAAPVTTESNAMPGKPAVTLSSAECDTAVVLEQPQAPAVVQSQHGLQLEPTAAAAPAAAAAAAGEANCPETAPSAASSDIDAVLEVHAAPAAPSTKPAATAHAPDPTTTTPAAAAAAAGAPTVSRPGVADAANLIAPGLVAKRRMAAIAAVESKDGPSPELQATPVIVTEGAGEKGKTGSRVKLSAW